ncbi:MAG: hypothetical protein NC218_10550 [Acetobacter sp.]|nr:hypothetical protein [Acetobacter sp.]
MDGLKNTKHKPMFAAIDLGTNSNRLLIVDENCVPVYRDVKHVALGEGLAEAGCFCSKAMERAICSFMDFAEMMQLYNVVSYRAIATAACRMSANTEAFRTEVKKSSGVEVEVISEFEEARLTLKGACLNAPKEPKYLFVYDLGGGSTEVSFATNTATPEILETYSIPLGARNATEMYQLQDYDAAGVLALETEVKRQLVDFLAKVRTYPDFTDAAVIATSSTPLRLAAWILKQPGYDKFAADGKCVAVADLDAVIAEILPLTYEERAKSEYVGANRAKIFVAACVIFRTIYQALGAREVVASLKGAQEAIVSELMASGGSGSTGND